MNWNDFDMSRYGLGSWNVDTVSVTKDDNNMLWFCCVIIIIILCVIFCFWCWNNSQYNKRCDKATCNTSIGAAVINKQPFGPGTANQVLPGCVGCSTKSFNVNDAGQTFITNQNGTIEQCIGDADCYNKLRLV